MAHCTGCTLSIPLSLYLFNSTCRKEKTKQTNSALARERAVLQVPQSGCWCLHCIKCHTDIMGHLMWAGTVKWGRSGVLREVDSTVRSEEAPTFPLFVTTRLFPLPVIGAIAFWILLLLTSEVTVRCLMVVCLEGLWPAWLIRQAWVWQTLPFSPFLWFY